MQKKVSQSDGTDFCPAPEPFPVNPLWHRRCPINRAETQRATGKATMGAMGKPTIRIGGTCMAVNLKYYRKLKSLMFEREIDQAYIAQKAERSRGYISDRFQDKKPFDMDDVYTIIEKAFNILTGKER